jgi:phospholipid/cholesterol/gamma-HCH transport system permease protein
MNAIGRLGQLVKSFFNILINMLGLLSLTIKETRHILKPTRRRIFWLLFKRQLYNSGVKAIYINTLIAILLSWVLMSKAYTLLNEGVTAANYYAQFFIIVVVRELGPLVSGIILISRSANAITAEIGHLKLYNEFDVLRSLRMSPVFMFMVPVFFSFPLSLLLMFFYFNLICILASYAFISVLYHAQIGLEAFISAILVNLTINELIISLAKACIGGSLIGLISIYFGANVGTRFTDISRAISNSTTTQLFVFFALNVSLSIVAYR